MKTEKRKAKIGERILITNPQLTGGYYVLNSVLSVVKTLNNTVITEDNPRWIRHEEYEVIVAKPKKSARITALESQVATLQAKVEALESAGKYPLTERFNLESPEVDAILADIERKAKPTPNEQRADVIKRAKAYLEDAKVVPDFGGEKAYFSKADGGAFGYYCNVEFHIDNDKRTVVALLRWRFNHSVRAKGIAKCDPDDVFNVDIGKAIALARALGVKYPKEFVKAVQPTEKVVGQYVRYEGHRVKLMPVDNNEIYRYIDEGTADYRSVVARRGRIIEDTDAVYE